MRRQKALEDIIMLGKVESRRKRGKPIMRWIDWITDLSLHDLSKTVNDRVFGRL